MIGLFLNHNKSQSIPSFHDCKFRRYKTFGLTKCLSRFDVLSTVLLTSVHRILARLLRCYKNKIRRWRLPFYLAQHSIQVANISATKTGFREKIWEVVNPLRNGCLSSIAFVTFEPSCSATFPRACAETKHIWFWLAIIHNIDLSIQKFALTFYALSPMHNMHSR